MAPDLLDASHFKSSDPDATERNLDPKHPDWLPPYNVVHFKV
jgi:hypothetical protein